MESSRVWALVLSGGEGERVSALTRRWLGRHCPKQYCAFVGTRSMLQHTYDRIAPLVPPQRIVTVIGKGHRIHLGKACRSGVPGSLIEQPVARGTAVGVFAGVSLILAQDPSATVVILPSDHFIFPETRLVRYLACAAAAVESLPDRLALLAAAARNPECEYGWIDSAEVLLRPYERTACAVSRFCEKPSPEDAERFFRSGWHWNTMIFAARGETLWALGRKCFPYLMEELEELRRLFALAGASASRTRRLQARILPAIYERLETADFSLGLLENCAQRCLAVPMPDLQWDDWGRPERILQSLERIGKRAAFPHHLCREFGGQYFRPTKRPQLLPNLSGSAG